LLTQTFRLLQQVLPEIDMHREASSIPKKGKQTVTVEKPNFSLPIMSANFRRFNARYGSFGCSELIILRF